MQSVLIFLAGSCDNLRENIWMKKVESLCMPLEHLEVKHCIYEKKGFLKISRVWHFFQIFNIPLLCAPNWHAKGLNIFLAGCCEDLCVNAWMKQVVTLHASSEHSEMKYWKYEKNVKFLSISRSQHFFQICNIPLLNAPQWHAKCLDIFSAGSGKIFVWVTGRSMSIHIISQFGALRSEILQIWKIFRFLRSSGILHLFRFAISTSKCFELAC
jgi:hypothetical protein